MTDAGRLTRSGNVVSLLRTAGHDAPLCFLGYNLSCSFADKEAMKQLWAPWRMEFLKSEPRADVCVFCDAHKNAHQRHSLVLHCVEYCFVIINKFPYTNGHLMVVPIQHTHDFASLPLQTAQQMMQLSQTCLTVLKQAYKPEGFNIGMNLGAAAGAGIRDHLHLHIVPRWTGDTNFMPVLADTKSMPQHLMESFDLLSQQFRRLA